MRHDYKQPVVVNYCIGYCPYHLGAVDKETMGLSEVKIGLSLFWLECVMHQTSLGRLPHAKRPLGKPFDVYQRHHISYVEYVPREKVGVLKHR